MATLKIESIHCKDFEAVAVQPVTWDAVNKQRARCKQTGLPYAPNVV